MFNWLCWNDLGWSGMVQRVKTAKMEEFQLQAGVGYTSSLLKFSDETRRTLRQLA